MPPKNDQVEKRKILVDGEEFEGLVNIGAYNREDDTVPVPGVDRVVPVRNGVEKVPEIPVTFKITRGSRTLKALQDWYQKRETHDVVMIRTDGAGNEFSRELWPKVELKNLEAPDYDAASPVFAQAMTTMLPERIIPVDAA